MMKREERGVMVMKDGKAWGIEYEDGHATVYGWIDPAIAPLSDPQFLRKPSDMTYGNSPYIKELNKGTIRRVTRITTVELER